MPTARIVIPYPPGRKLLRALCVLFLLFIVGFCTFYLLNTYAYLTAWFRNLDPCFYRNVYWERDFFVPAVKHHGNFICIAGILGSVVVLTFLFIKKKNAVKKPVAPLVVLTLTDIIYLLLLVIAGIGMWLFAHHHILPYMDEVFSAIHCADGHPFQAYAYYMLPNNHIFYNVLNSVVFHGAKDHVLTGRIISGVSFICLLLLLYGWCRQLMNHRLLAFLTTLAIAVHFQTWGFGAMGRGYELYLLCEWAAFIALWQYLKNGEVFWLRFFTISVIIGFATLPTFLFFYVALILIAFIAQSYQRKIDLRFVKYAVATVTIIFLFYLPALCFSGLHAFLSNEYVVPKNITSAAYFGVVIDKIHESLIYCFTGYYTLKEDFYLVLACIPLLSLLFLRQRQRLFIGLFYLLMWISVLLIGWQMRQYPYQRNLIGHLSFTYTFLLITVFWLLKALLERVKWPKLTIIVFPLFLSLFFYHYVKIAQDKLALAVYHFDINRYGELLEMDLRDLPPKANVAFSDESFYLLYLSRKKGFITTECGNGNEEYYIKIDGEILPQPPTGHYQLMWERGDYRVYQRKYP